MRVFISLPKANKCSSWTGDRSAISWQQLLRISHSHRPLWERCSYGPHSTFAVWKALGRVPPFALSEGTSFLLLCPRHCHLVQDFSSLYKCLLSRASVTVIMLILDRKRKLKGSFKASSSQTNWKFNACRCQFHGKSLMTHDFLMLTWVALTSGDRAETYDLWPYDLFWDN